MRHEKLPWTVSVSLWAVLTDCQSVDTVLKSASSQRLAWRALRSACLVLAQVPPARQCRVTVPPLPLLFPHQGEAKEAWGLYPCLRRSALVALGSPGEDCTGCPGY